MTVAELQEQLREVTLKLLEIEEAARGIAAEARTQASEVQRIRVQVMQELKEKVSDRSVKGENL